ncbi:MAG: hypothetical protein KAI38_06325 [Candidatus Latescibacteria bacterium]|nr:hypothetical protein [Candidatus Latescibacterota bacterium]
MIDKLVFLIHPLCYAGCEDEGRCPMPEASFRAYVEYERTILPKWIEGLSQLAPNEALVLLPIGRTKSQRALEEGAQEVLGARCVVVRAAPSVSGAFLPGLDDAFKTGVAEDLMAAFQARGYEWRAQDMKVAVFSRAYAREIESAFIERGLAFDPKTVRAEAWGESFEGCVTKWSNGMGTYLRLSNPIEKKFEMTVPDAPFILCSNFVECVPLANEVRLFLFEGSDMRPIGVFLKASHRVWDRLLSVHLPADPEVFEVQKKMGGTLWPAEDSGTTSEEIVKVPVYGGSYSDEPTYIFGKERAFSEFRERLVELVISE